MKLGYRASLDHQFQNGISANLQKWITLYVSLIAGNSIARQA